jgi:hypothetical protein
MPDLPVGLRDITRCCIRATTRITRTNFDATHRVRSDALARLHALRCAGRRSFARPGKAPISA